MCKEIDFIKNLELADTAFPMDFSDFNKFESTGEIDSYLNYKGLNSFSSEVSEQARKDALNSMLFAQRAATNKFPDESMIYDWYNMYFEVLKKLGWLLQTRDYTDYEEQSSLLEIDKVIFDLIKDLLTAQQAKIFIKSLELIKKLGKEDKRLKAFERNTEAQNKANFQLGLIEEHNGEATILGSGFIIQSEIKITSILFIKFDKKKVKLTFNFYKATLVEHQYARFRDLIKDKLGDLDEFIAALDV